MAGNTATTLPREEIAHHEAGAEKKDARGEGMALLTHLLTRWTVRPDSSTSGKGREQTVVDLSIEFAFGNPLYAALSAGAAPKVAEIMIRAFEERVKVVLGNEGALDSTGLERRNPRT